MDKLIVDKPNVAQNTLIDVDNLALNPISVVHSPETGRILLWRRGTPIAYAIYPEELPGLVDRLMDVVAITSEPEPVGEE